jgi:hypothetical protein
MSALRQLGWFVAAQAVLQRSFVSSLAIRATTNTTNTNTTIPPDLSHEVLNCSSTLVIPILQFVITNYIAHAFTIRFSPGYGAFYTTIFSLKALIFPCFGLLTACRKMELLARCQDDPLKCALEAGALCTVARTKEWKPEEGDDIWLPCVPPNSVSLVVTLIVKQDYDYNYPVADIVVRLSQFKRVMYSKANCKTGLRLKLPRRRHRCTSISIQARRV